MAAAERASSSSYRCSYDAFLSFRGEDTRKGFTDHLYRALELAGIHTFRDDDGIERGANIVEELHKAIQEAKVSIIVFSKGYASSRWCLDELVKIMEHRKAYQHMIVMPVFYHVDPSHVRKQIGSFAQAFSRHEERFKDEMDKVEEWRRALRDVADLGGMVLGDRYESQFIQDIVEEIGNKLDHKALNVARYAVGIDHRMQGINKWLEDGSNDVDVAVIYGMGGIGKTTIAKAAYNQKFHRFQGSSFLTDIRATSEQTNGLVHLQRKLLWDIQKGKTKEIYSIDEGKHKIKHAICCKRVLIVLDDVNHLDQFNAILEMREWLHPGSKIIITTRHENLLKAHHDVYAMFKVIELDECEALELFSWHAFGQAQPIEGYWELSRLVVQQCGGLPLALQVLGSSLSGKSVEVWQSALQKLDMILDGKIQKVLRISFDSLEDDHDRDLFLHIACFFIGKKKDYAITVLDKLDFCTMVGIQNLVDRCLVQISLDNKLVMHQLLRDMGRGVIREESPEDPGKRSRVCHKDAFSILGKLTGTETIKGLMLDLPMLQKGESSETKFSRSTKKRCHVEDYDGNCTKRRQLGFFSWQSVDSSSTNSALAPNEVDFKSEAFRRMQNLKLLLLNNVKVSGCYEDFPINLVWLSWRGFPLKSVPVDFHLENLVVLDMRNSSLQHVWKGTRFLPRLKILNLSHSHGLMTTPDASGLPNLERLVLKDCISLVEVDESIGDLDKLVFLNLKDCKNLLKLPTRIRMLRSLEELILSGCSKLELHANITATNKLYSTTSDVKKLSQLSAKLWNSIWFPVSPRFYFKSTRFSLANVPHSLGSLSLVDCNLLEIPNDLSLLSLLKHLNLSDNPILSLPENMNSLIMLEELLLQGCARLQRLPELPQSLKFLQVKSCESLKRMTNVPNMFRSLELYVHNFDKLIEVPSLFNIKPLRSINIEMIQDMGMHILEPTGSTEVQTINYLAYAYTKAPVQCLYECGIFSNFLYGSKIPDWCSYRSMSSSVLAISVPSHPNLKIRALNVCVVYALCPDKTSLGFRLPSAHLLKVSNETKGLQWTYCPVAIGHTKENEDRLWLSHWRFGDYELEGGEEVCVSVNKHSSLLTKEFGVQFVFEEDTKVKGVQSNWEETPPLSLNNNVPLSESKHFKGKYFLSNYRYQDHRDLFRWRQDFSYDPKEDDYRFFFKHEDGHVKRILDWC